MRRALLDVNVLLALFDPDHLQHGLARSWLGREGEHGWASCALTQSGFLRILSQPRYPNPEPVGAAWSRLARACDAPHHEFWPGSVSLVDPAVLDPTQLTGHRQITDAYLLALAVANQGRLVTFDRSIPLAAVRGAGTEHLTLLPASSSGGTAVLPGQGHGASLAESDRRAGTP